MENKNATTEFEFTSEQQTATRKAFSGEIRKAVRTLNKRLQAARNAFLYGKSVDYINDLLAIVDETKQVQKMSTIIRQNFAVYCGNYTIEIKNEKSFLQYNPKISTIVYNRKLERFEICEETYDISIEKCRELASKLENIENVKFRLPDKTDPYAEKYARLVKQIQLLSETCEKWASSAQAENIRALVNAVAQAIGTDACPANTDNIDLNQTNVELNGQAQKITV